jgi:hypothetical protein
MALSSSQGLSANLNKSYAVSQRANWQELASLDITTADTTNLTNPSAAITSALTTLGKTDPSNSRVVAIEPGTNLILRLKYNTSLSTVTDPVVKVFGIDKSGKFHFLKNLSGSAAITITTSASDDGDADVRDSSFRYTDVASTSIVDLQGSTYFLMVVSTALNGTGTKSTARIQYKIV